MKGKTKILVSSALAIAASASLITGATYAIFTSESKTDIAITSGKVNVSATISSLDLYSPTLIDSNTCVVTDPVNAATTSNFKNGGTATIDGNKLMLTNMVPGDKVTFDVEIKNNSNVTCQYRTSVKFTSESLEGFAHQFLIGLSDDGTNYAYYTQYVANWETAASDLDVTKHVSIEMPTYVSNPAWQEQTCTIELGVEAVQGNVSVTNDLTATNKVHKVSSQTDIETLLGASGEFASGDMIVLDGGVWDKATITMGETDNRTLYLNGYKVNTLTINAPAASVHEYNDVGDKTVVTAVANNSLHIYGRMPEVEVEQGRVVIEIPADITGVGTITVKPASGKTATLEISEGKTVPQVVLAPTGGTATLTVEEKASVNEVKLVPTESGTATLTVEEEASISKVVVPTEATGDVALTVNGEVDSYEVEGSVTPEIATGENGVIYRTASGYDEFANAISEINDGSSIFNGVKLTDDITLEALVTIKKSTVIDLDEHTITVNNGATYSIQFLSGSNGSAIKNGTLESDNTAPIYVNDCSCTVENMTVNATAAGSHGVYGYNKATANVVNSTITAGKYGVYGWGATANIVNSTISATTCGVYGQSGTETTITNSTITATTYGVYQSSSKITISDNTTIKSNSQAVVLLGSSEATIKTCKIESVNKNALYVIGAAQLKIENSQISSGSDGIQVQGAGKVEASGCTINAPSGVSLFDNSTITLTDCDITASSYALSTNAHEVGEINVTINGGHFISKEGTAIMYNQGGSITVSDCEIEGAYIGVFMRAGTGTFTNCKITSSNYIPNDPEDQEWVQNGTIGVIKANVVVGTHPSNTAYPYSAVVTLTGCELRYTDEDAQSDPLVFVIKPSVSTEPAVEDRTSTLTIDGTEVTEDNGTVHILEV